MGWPPVNHWRKKLHVEEVVGNNNNIDHMVWVDHRQTHSLQGYSSNTLYVKVKMEGVGIARKVDLSMHQSFHTLKETLMDMFGKCKYKLYMTKFIHACPCSIPVNLLISRVQINRSSSTIKQL